MPMSTKRKAPAKLAAPTVRSTARIPTKTTIDESRTSISAPDAIQGAAAVDAISISSDADSDDEDISDAEDPAAVPPTKVNGVSAKPSRRTNGTQGEAMEEDGGDGSDAEATSPSFGELLKGNEAIDVSALLHQSSSSIPNNKNKNNDASLAQSRSAIIAPAHQSLTTVLTQALKTDDVDLLESCLHTTDLNTIRNTIERIDATLAGALLNSLASRLYRRPGRAGNLMIWVQWTLISHGGALASQPEVVHNLNSLQKVLAERAKGLGSLLALKGKLDLLEGQMDLRKKMRRRSSGLDRDENEANDDEDDDDEEDLIYVEGEVDSKTVTETDLLNGIASRRIRNRRSGDDDGDDDDAVPSTYHEIADSDSDSDADGVAEDDSEGQYDEDSDDEDNQDSDAKAAEESLDEAEVDHEDVDDSMGEEEEEEESDAEAAAPPSKMPKTTAKSAGKRR